MKRQSDKRATATALPVPDEVQGTEVSPWIWGAVLAGLGGMALALVMIPVWVPTLGASIVSADPKFYWYLSRASAMVAFGLLWVSMASGLIITNKMARIWPGAFTAFDLHQYTSLLGLGFALFHGLILLGNAYVPYSLVQIVVPFGNGAYRQLWVGIGQVALYVSALVSFTFYVRRRIGNRAWHVIHFLSYGLFALALLHGVFAGTDTSNVWVAEMYWFSAVSLALLTIFRVVSSRPAEKVSRRS
jgi:predicted ferric reductase